MERVQSSVAISLHEWPFLTHYSTENMAAYFAALIPGVNIIRMLVIGLGILKDEATVKSMSRFGDYRLQYCSLESQWEMFESVKQLKHGSFYI